MFEFHVVQKVSILCSLCHETEILPFYFYEFPKSMYTSASFSLLNWISNIVVNAFFNLFNLIVSFTYFLAMLIKAFSYLFHLCET